MAGLVRQPLPLTLYKNTQLIILSVKILSSFGSKEPFRTPERRETDIVRRCLNGRKSGGCDIPRPAFQFPRIVKDLSRPHVGRDRPTPCLFGSLIAHSRTWSRQLPRRSAVDIYLDGNPSFAPPLERQMMVIHHRSVPLRRINAWGRPVSPARELNFPMTGITSGPERRPTWGRSCTH